MGRKVLSKNGTFEDTIRHIKRIIRQQSQSGFIAQRVNHIRSITQDATEQTKVLWKIELTRKYENDEAGIEALKRPSRFAKDGKGDCDDYTIDIGATLLALGIRFEIVVVDWEEDGWDHIYVYAYPNGVKTILDPVTVTSRQMIGGGYNIEKSDYRLIKIIPMEIHELDGLGGPKKYKPKHRQKVKRDGLGRIIIISDGNVTLDKKVCGHIQGEPCNCGKSPKEKIRYDLPKNTEKIKPKPNATTGQPVDRMGPKEVFLTNLMIERDNMRASEMIVKERLKQKGVDLKGLGSLTVADLLDEIIAAVALKNEDGDFMKSASVQGLLGLGNVRGKKGLGLFKNLRDTLKKAGSSGDAIQNKILNKTKSVTGSVLDKAKSAALGIPRYLFEQFISKAPGLALYFLPSFVNNRAVLLKYPKVNRKKQKTDRILQFLSKLVRLDRDGMMKVLRTAIINKTRQTPDMLLKQFVQQSTVKGLGVIPPQLIMVIIQALPLILNLVKMFMDKTGEAPPEMPAEGDILQEADFLDDVQTMVNLPANTGFDTNEAGQTGQVDSEGNFLDFGVNTSVGLDQPTQDLITNLKDDAWDATKIIMWVGGGLTVITIAGLVIYGITKNKK